jgi:hypothetical protein
LPLSLPLPLKLAPEASKNKSLRRFASRALLASHVVTWSCPPCTACMCRTNSMCQLKPFLSWKTLSRPSGQTRAFKTRSEAVQPSHLAELIQRTVGSNIEQFAQR